MGLLVGTDLQDHASIVHFLAPLLRPYNVKQPYFAGAWLLGADAVTTLTYCPPEALRAEKLGEKFEISEAVDIWALGVMSFELLACINPFVHLSYLNVEERLCGQRPLPWEEEGYRAKQLLQWLGVMQDTVLACLKRDPSQRPSAANVCQACSLAVMNVA